MDKHCGGEQVILKEVLSEWSHLRGLSNALAINNRGSAQIRRRFHPSDKVCQNVSDQQKYTSRVTISGRSGSLLQRNSKGCTIALRLYYFDKRTNLAGFSKIHVFVSCKDHDRELSFMV